MNEIVDPSRIVVVTDYANRDAAIYVDGKLHWAHNADEAVNWLVTLTRNPMDFHEERLWDYEGGVDAMLAYTTRHDIYVIEQETIFPENSGDWKSVPATLDEVEELATY